MVNKGIWLSYDFGVAGDYPGLYKWLDNKEARECGNNIAFFKYPIEKEQINELNSVILTDIEASVRLRPGDRLYLISLESTPTGTRVNGEFIFGKRKGNPWEGYGDKASSGSDDGE